MGNRAIETPAFDRVAREGVLFTHTFCCAASCTPSFSSGNGDGEATPRSPGAPPAVAAPTSRIGAASPAARASESTVPVRMPGAADGSIIGTFGISRDITDRIRAEKILRDNGLGELAPALEMPSKQATKYDRDLASTPHAHPSEGVHLVVHQGDQRGDDQRRARQHLTGQLIAEALSASCGHQHKSVLSAHNGFNDVFLKRSEAGVTKDRS